MLNLAQDDELEVLVFNGAFQWKNIFVQNPKDPNGIGYSIKRVEVNGEIWTTEIARSTFKIDLIKNSNLQTNDSVLIKFFYKGEVTPRILNENALTPKSIEEFLSINVDSLGLLSFCTKYETYKSTYYIEQFMWNKWVVVGEIWNNFTSSDSVNCYQFQTDLISGENKFRITTPCDFMNYCPGGNANCSTSVKTTPKEPMIYELHTKGNDLLLSNPTRYEVYDSNGNLVKRGYTKDKFFVGLPKGLYYINYDNTTGDVWNKKK